MSNSVDKSIADSFPDIYDFTADGHVVLNKLESSSKTTIALTTGLSLGGGLELALACDYRIGTRKTQFGFPETSIGIFEDWAELSVLLESQDYLQQDGLFYLEISWIQELPQI